MSRRLSRAATVTAAAALTLGLAACGGGAANGGGGGGSDPGELVLGLVPSQDVDQLVTDAE